MTITVEDGTIVSGANSYIGLTDAQTYWSTWVLSVGTNNTTQTNALIAATYALDKLFGRYYIGRQQKDCPQNLLWPRQFDAETFLHVEVEDTSGSGAVLLPRVVNGVVTSIFVVSGGSGYTAPTLTIPAAKAQATATAAITSGAISSVTVTNGGQGYCSPRQITANDYTTIKVNQIPQALKDAQCEIAALYINGANIFPEVSDERKFTIFREQFAEYNSIKTYRDPLTTDGERLEGFRKIELLMTPIINSSLVSL